jgi:hypothetical protein
MLAKIAGSFSVVPINILNADLFPRADNTVLGVFRVCDTKAHAITDPRDFELVEQTLRCALEDERFDFLPVIEKATRQSRKRSAPAIEFPTRIAMDNKTHPIYTLIEIQAPDRLGLLYDILTCLDRENVSIALSRINTQDGAAIDTLYVMDRGTHAKITDSHRITAIQKHLQNAILSGAAVKPVSKQKASAQPSLLLIVLFHLMNALILAAGYATRLYPLTRDKAKPLLTVGGKPIIEWVVDNLVDVPELETIYIVTNDKFASDFQTWSERYQDRQPKFKFKIINDGPKRRRQAGRNWGYQFRR